MSAGKLFQRAGPATRNTLAPRVERRTGGTRRWLDDEERSRKSHRLGTSDRRVNGPRYSGALPWRTWWTRTTNLNWIRSGMRNQCSDRLLIVILLTGKDGQCTSEMIHIRFTTEVDRQFRLEPKVDRKMNLKFGRNRNATETTKNCHFWRRNRNRISISLYTLTRWYRKTARSMFVVPWYGCSNDIHLRTLVYRLTTHYWHEQKLHSSWAKYSQVTNWAELSFRSHRPAKTTFCISRKDVYRRNGRWLSLHISVRPKTASR